MAHRQFDEGHGVTSIRTTGDGIVAHIIRRDDDKYIVREDKESREFNAYGEALDCARGLGRDTDL